MPVNFNREKLLRKIHWMNLSWEIMFQQNIFSIIYKEKRLVFHFFLLLFIKKREKKYICIHVCYIHMGYKQT